MQASFAGKSSQVRMLVEVEEIMLGVDSAVPCGLIVNELVTTLAEQLDGTIAMRNGTGTTFEISFPETHSAKL